MKIKLIQINPKLGAINENRQKIVQSINMHNDADLIVFPELVLTGYPPDDMLWNPSFQLAIEQAVSTIKSCIPKDTTVLIGTPRWSQSACYNACAILRHNHATEYYDKQLLATRDVFNEPRHFTAGDSAKIIQILDKRCLVAICEDLWHEPQNDHAIDLILSLNASPFTRTKHQARVDAIARHAKHYQADVCYCNLVGGQDELIFDGNSFFYDHTQGITHRASAWVETHLSIDLSLARSPLDTDTDHDHECYEAIKLGLSDYCQKNKLKSVVIGLSGGIDSALTLALCNDSFGAEQIHAFYLPSHHNSSLSESLVFEQCQRLGIHCTVISIDPLMMAYETAMTHEISLNHGLTNQNIQARIRTDILMAAANERNAILINTSNKSESAMGYSTLYGDMAGAYAPLKDLLKTQVYALAVARNKRSPVIPEGVIERKPSAELAPNQLDEDSLPSYSLLDPVLEAYLNHTPLATIIAESALPEKTIVWIIQRLHRNEHKRFQHPPGPKVSECAFGRNRVWPITFCDKHLQPNPEV